MEKARNLILAFIATALLLLPALTVAAEDELTIAAILPLSGQFGPAGHAGGCWAKGLLCHH